MVPTRARRLPSRIHLPFGYVVSVCQVTDREMRELIEERPDLSVCQVTDREMRELIEERPDGCWVVEERRIYLRKYLNPRRKRYILIHELSHALNDMLHELLNDGTVRN